MWSMRQTPVELLLYSGGQESNVLSVHILENVQTRSNQNGAKPVKMVEKVWKRPKRQNFSNFFPAATAAAGAAAKTKKSCFIFGR